MYDVIIVGAGPSGSMCAYLLAKDFNVVLIEKTNFPRRKLCGGGVSNKAVKLLDGIIDMKMLSGKSLTGSYLCYKNQHLIYTNQDIANHSIERSEFDNELLLAAKNAGAEIIMPSKAEKIEENDKAVKVTLIDGTELKSKFLVIAEGVNGKLYESAGYFGTRDMTMALEADVFPKYYPANFNKNALFDFGSIPKGYAWIFPKKDYLNIGAYYYKSKSIDRSQIEALECFIKQFSWSDGIEIINIKGHAIPRSIDYAAYNTNRTLLVGDSAGTVENFYGEGIFYGLKSSRIAAEEITKAIRNNGSLDNYSKRLKSEILVQVKFSKRTAESFYTRQKFGYNNIVQNKLSNRYYAELINGKISQRKCFYLTMAFLPISIFTKKLQNGDYEEIGLIK
jgi:geranylgeranyl reductase family protein